MFNKIRENKAELRTEKLPYEVPTVSRIKIHNTDIITESHFDPNQGEWDYEE